MSQKIHRAHADLEQLLIPIKSIKPFPGNPRRGNQRLIEESLERNGQYRPIVVNRRGKTILAGNHTWMAASELGWTHIAATWVDADDDQARRIVAIDNRASDVAKFDDTELAHLLEQLPDLDGTGYDGDDLQRLLDKLEPGEAEGGAGAVSKGIECPHCGTFIAEGRWS